LRALGYGEEYIDALMGQVNRSGSGKISFEEFAESASAVREEDEAADVVDELPLQPAPPRSPRLSKTTFGARARAPPPRRAAPRSRAPAQRPSPATMSTQWTIFSAVSGARTHTHARAHAPT
jgi:hypothetical protein